MNSYSSGGWKKWIWLYVVLAAVIYGGIYYYYKNNNSSGGLYGNTTTPTPSVAATLVTTGTIINTEPGTSNNNGVAYLADATGHTLYMYGSDTKGVSNCSASCLTDWPVYGPSGTATPATLPSKVTIITRADGTLQYAYDGMPLYTFTGDTSVGQVTGDGVGGFTLMKPDM